jgi:AcrR family transcriptional regulator
MSRPSLRDQFRQQVRERALQVAHSLTVERGWAQVRVNEVAELTGVSRPTLYAEFGDKHGLGEALVLRETDAFLSGMAELLQQYDNDAQSAVTEAVRYALQQAEASPLLRAILTSARGVDQDLLPLLTTDAAPIFRAASQTLVAWFSVHFPKFPHDEVEAAVDALVRLTVSHIVMPAEESIDQTAARLASLALRFIEQHAVRG